MNQEKNTKKLKYGINSTVIIIGAIIAAVLLNSILVAFDDKISLEIDLTQNEIYKLSDSTKKVVKGIDEDVKIGILYDGREIDESDEFMSVMKSIVDKYTQENEKIKCELIDYYNDPTPLLKGEYPQGAISEITARGIKPLYAMIIVKGDEYQITDPQNYFEETYDKEKGTIEGKSAIEKVLTNKLSEFGGNAKKFSAILYTTGHGEKVNRTIGSLLNKNGLTPAFVELANFKGIEGETPLLIIDSPETDFTVEEIENLDTFLKNNGCAQFYFNPLISNEELPRLEGYLKDEWGIIRNHGVIYDNTKAVALDDDDKEIYGTIAVGEYTDHEILNNIRQSGIKVMYSAANALEIKSDKGMDVEVSSVLKTSSDALLKPLETALVPENTDGEKGEYNVILTSVWDDIKENGDQVTGKVLVCGSSYTLDTLPLQADCANEELLLNSFNWMSGNTQDVNVEVKDFPEGGLVLENTPKWIWFATLVVIIPLVILAAGIIIFTKRRYK